MTTPLLKRKSVIAAKVETTVGTEESLTASEGNFNPYNVTVTPAIEVEEREDPGSFNRRKGASAARTGTISFTHDLQWDETAALPGWASTFMSSCGWVTSTLTQTPRSEAPGTNVKTLTIATYEDGVKKFLTGAVGNFNFVFPAGRNAYIEFEFQGAWNPPIDSAMLVVTHPTDDLLRFASSTITWNSVVQGVEQVSIASGNEIYMREDPATLPGIISGIITDRKPTITLNPEAELTKTTARHTAWTDNTEAAFSLVIGGSLTISAPKAQHLDVQSSDRGKLLVDDITLACNKNGANEDEELSLVWA